MEIVQPKDLTRFFTIDQELYMQRDIKDKLAGRLKPGFYNLCHEYEGRKTKKYFIEFAIECTKYGHLFIIEIYIEEIGKRSREEFEKATEKLSENIATSENRKLALEQYQDKHADLVRSRNLINWQSRKN